MHACLNKFKVHNQVPLMNIEISAKSDVNKIIEK